ncbi:MAG TPA: nucleoside transporter C-terminal domain-containing protein [Pirellulaceae bacterium]|nr:nucleoside transporter C-terminal domain-containing protein [Pirellulaceae bacterium]
MERCVSFAGYFVMIGLAWLLSQDKRRFPWRAVLVGTLLQLVLAVVILRTTPGAIVFTAIGEAFRWVSDLTEVGSRFVFGERFLEHPFAFKVLPTIIFFSSLAAMLYYLGVMQVVVKSMAVVMQKLMGVSGAESLSASANVFLGQTEAPLLVKPYISAMTLSELNAVMIGGFANISGSLIAAFSAKEFGLNAGHLVTASVISAPASLLIAKVLVPETERPTTLGAVTMDAPPQGVNLIEAAAIGAADGVKLAINVAAMLIAFIALIAMLDSAIHGLGWCLSQVAGNDLGQDWSLSTLLGYLFAPIAWIIGIESQDCLPAGQLLGKKMFANEFVAYAELAKWQQTDSTVHLSERSVTIMTYALCGFANFSSIGIQIGGLGGMAPERQSDVARLGLRAMLGGTIVNCMMGCIAGVLA